MRRFQNELPGDSGPRDTASPLVVGTSVGLAVPKGRPYLLVERTFAPLETGWTRAFPHFWIDFSRI